MNNWQHTLQQLVLKPNLHARFLNTLSLLEYIGSRKIMKSQDEKNITPTTLSHMAEEIRHAQILKRMAIKVGGDAVKSYSEESLLCGQLGRDYIQSIDATAAEVIGDKNPLLNYLLTTLIVEERAQEIYPFYDEILIPLGLNGPLKGIFREEEEHLSQVISLLKNFANCTEQDFEKVRTVEKMQFDAFFSAVALEIQRDANLEARV